MILEAFRSALCALSLSMLLSGAAAQERPVTSDAAGDNEREVPYSQYDFAAYRGTGEVLVRAPGVSITDSDFFLYALMTDQLNLADVVKWHDVTSVTTRKKMKRILDQYLRSSVWSTRVEEPLDSALRDKFIRIYSGNTARMIWADKVVRDELDIFPEDILHHIKTNRGRFYSKETVTVRRLRVPLTENQSIEALNAARDRAEALRTEALRGDGLEPLLKAHPELLVDPPGRLLEIARDNADLDPQVLDRVFQLRPTQISQPIRTPAGFTLVEVVTHNLPRQPPIDEASAKAFDDLRDKLLPFQVDYRVGKLIKKALPITRPNLWEFLPDDADMVRVRGFRFTKGDMKTFLPEVFNRGEFPRKVLIVRVVEAMVNEVIMQDLEKKKLLPGDEWYERSREIAGVIVDANTEIRRRRALISPTDEEAAAFRDANPERFNPGRPKLVWRAMMTVRDADEVSPGEVESLKLLMQVYLRNIIDSAMQQLGERRGIIGERAYDQVSTIVGNLPRVPDERVRVQFDQIGAFNRWTARDLLAVDYDELELGQFTRPEIERGAVVTSYFVSEILPEVPLEEDFLLELARGALINDLAEQELTDQIEEWEAAGTLQWHPQFDVSIRD